VAVQISRVRPCRTPLEHQYFISLGDHEEFTVATASTASEEEFLIERVRVKDSTVAQEVIDLRWHITTKSYWPPISDFCKRLDGKVEKHHNIDSHSNLHQSFGRLFLKTYLFCVWARVQGLMVHEEMKGLTH